MSQSAHSVATTGQRIAFVHAQWHAPIVLQARDAFCAEMQKLGASADSIDVQTGRTIGIDLSNPPLLLPGTNGEPAIEAVPWDFAGQELSYLSHSVHLSARCVYVLVWSPRKEEDESSRDTADGIVQPMFEWLQILSSHVPDA